MKLPLLAATLVIAAVSTDAGAKCAMTELAPKLLTPDGAKLPADGGILVSYESRMPDDRANRARDLKPTYKGSVELDARLLAPGVYVYSTKDKGTGSISVTDGKTKVGTFARGGTDKNDLPAPDTSNAQVASSRGYRNTSTVFSVDVAAVPDAAVGVLTYDDKGTALSFNTVAHDKTGKTTIEPYHSPGRCAFDPDNTRVPNSSENVTIAWIDKFGRVGKPSKPFKVNVLPVKESRDD